MKTLNSEAFVETFNNLQFTKIGDDSCTVPGYEYSSTLFQSSVEPNIMLLIDIAKLVEFNVKLFNSKEDTEQHLIENDINITLGAEAKC